MEKERPSGAHQSPAGGSDLWEIAGVLISWRRFIIINLLLATAIVFTVTLLLPTWYKATASILPPKEPDAFSPLGSAGGLLRGLAPNGALSGTGGGTGAYNYFAILKSRGTMEAVIRKFGLIGAHDISDSSMEKAIRKLSGNVSFEMQEDDNILIEVFDQDPDRAAAMANSFVDMLNEISTQLGTKEGRSNREFIDKRLERSNQELRAAEDSLRSYQERTGMIIIPDEGSSSVDPVAQLYGLKARKEVELAILKRTTSEDLPAVKQVEMELSELKRKIATFPGIEMESLRLYSAVAVKQKIVEFLIPLYEQARIAEQKDVPVITVLDKAVTPERTTKPHRAMIVFLGLSLALQLLIVMAFLMQGIVRNPPGAPFGDHVKGAVLRVARRYRIDVGR